MPTIENWEMTAVMLGITTEVTTRRTALNAVVPGTPPPVMLVGVSTASFAQVVPPSTEPKRAAPVASEAIEYDCGRNGSGNTSCTHSPATPSVVTLLVYKPFTLLYAVADTHAWLVFLLNAWYAFAGLVLASAVYAPSAVVPVRDALSAFSVPFGHTNAVL